jgi:hypothetical protein
MTFPRLLPPSDRQAREGIALGATKAGSDAIGAMEGGSTAERAEKRRA